MKYRNLGTKTGSAVSSGERFFYKTAEELQKIQSWASGYFQRKLLLLCSENHYPVNSAFHHSYNLPLELDKSK